MSRLHLYDPATTGGVTLLTLESGVDNAGEYNEILAKSAGMDMGAIRFYHNDPGSQYATEMRFATRATSAGSLSEYMTIKQDGNVGIGTTLPVAKLQVVGTAGNETGTWSTVSDRRLKEDIQPLEGSLATVMKLQGVSFKWRDKTKGNKLHRGFIAQEVEEIIPEWVWKDSNGYRWLEKEGAEAILVEAIKEQQKEIDSLKQDLAEIKKRLDLAMPARKKE